MKKKITGMACGLAAASIVAFMLTACSDDSTSVSPVNDTSSIQEPLSSDSDTPASNGNVAPTSSESNQDSPASSGNDAPAPASSDNGSPASSDTPASSSDVAPNSSSDVAPASSDTDTTNFNANNCRPGGDCDGDGIPDGIYRPDLEPCATEDSTMEFYSRIFTCKEGKWVFTPDADDVDPIREAATGAKAERNNGPAVAPSVVKVKNADGTVTFRDDGADIYDFNSVSVGAELYGDTLIAHVEFPDSSTQHGFTMGALTFTLSNSFANVNYLQYSNRSNVHPVREVEALSDCGNNSSCVQCPPDQDCGGMAW